MASAINTPARLPLKWALGGFRGNRCVAAERHVPQFTARLTI
jgi:hypothetical protein